MSDRESIAPYDGHGDRLLFENDDVAVWEEVFEPGKPTRPHRHMRDYIAVTLDDGELRITALSEEPEVYQSLAGDIRATQETENRTRVGYRTGTVLHATQPEKGHAHIAENVGGRPTRVLLIELKHSDKRRE